MAVSNRDRVGKALELLGTALGSYVDRRMTKRSTMGGNWKAAYTDRNVESDASALIGVMLDHWQAVFKDELKTLGRNLVGDAQYWRNEWAHNKPFSYDDAFRAVDTIERILDLIDATERAEVGRFKSDLQRARYEAEAKSATPKPAALFADRPVG